MTQALLPALVDIAVGREVVRGETTAVADMAHTQVLETVSAVWLVALVSVAASVVYFPPLSWV